ncbi:ribosome biogenesis protein Nop16 [Cerioporus squamosus]|nr:ribosome biogenesis protein Nop16 [Cerioporus squamosus]
MANPRQRRKLRSGSHKPVQHSSRAKKLLKKQPPLRNDETLELMCRLRLRSTCSYEALGLAASLNPIASGGTERPLGTHAAEEENCSKPEASTSGQWVPKGYGKIIRDAEGNVVDVQLGDDEDEDEATATEEAMEDVPDPSADEQLAGWVGLGSDPRARPPQGASTRVVQALEHLSEAGGKPVKRFTSKGELGTLRRLVARYGEDVDAMARDRKLNADQRTAGELRRAIRKAGGFAALGLGRGG